MYFNVMLRLIFQKLGHKYAYFQEFPKRFTYYVSQCSHYAPKLPTILSIFMENFK